MFRFSRQNIWLAEIFMDVRQISFFRHKIILRVLLPVLLLVLPAASNVAAEQVARAYDLKAALLYQFSRFITWPADSVKSQGSFNVCVMGQDPFGKRLEGLKKRKYQDYSITVRYPQNKQDVSGCHILYLANPDCSLCKELSSPVLMVSSKTGFVDMGGEIEFVEEKGRIRFSINADSIKVRKLKVSAKLFEVASRVVGNVSN